MPPGEETETVLIHLLIARPHVIAKRYHSVMLEHARRILGPMPGSDETVLEDSRLRHGVWEIGWLN